MSTRAVEVSIHTVSPLSIFDGAAGAGVPAAGGAAAAGAGAPGATGAGAPGAAGVCANAADAITTTKRAMNARKNRFTVEVLQARSDGTGAGIVLKWRVRRARRCGSGSRLR